jgi:hypothetical protein
VAFDISVLKKPAGTPCSELTPDGKCGNYANRPEVCRAFKPDELCTLVSTLPLKEKVKIIMEVYK